MLLTILIPTIDDRAAYFDRLMVLLAPKLGDDAMVLPLRDNGEISIGEKRQRLLHMAETPYVAFFDDDDEPSEPREGDYGVACGDYVGQVVEALKTDPDIVGFRQRHFIDGELKRLKSLTRTDAAHPYDRSIRGIKKHRAKPNHLCPVRREIALAIGFQPMDCGEDCDYTRRLHETFPNLREAFVDAYLYDYLYRIDRAGETTHLRRETATTVTA